MNRRFLNAALAGIVLVFPSMVSAATYVVTKVGDSNDGVCDADCSLREAVAAAVASPDDDVIEFDPALFATPQTIALSGSEIVVTANGRLDIIGPGADVLTVSGGGASRIITNAPGAITSISDIGFTAGNGVGAANTGRGGAIYNSGGTLSLARVVVFDNTGNTGGGINNASGGTPSIAGTLTIDESLLLGNTSVSSGGAIQNFSSSTLVIRNSAFVGNTSGGSTGGGAAQLNGLVTISNTTFSGNSAPGGSGGAIQSNGSLLLLTNVTIAANSSTNNGGGLHRATTNANAFVRNTLIAANAGVETSPDVTHSAGGLNSLGFNLIGAVGTSNAWVETDLVDVDARLEPLADNGGFTPTHALGEDSPAIDAGDDCVLDQSCAEHNIDVNLDSDQRGQPRPFGAAVDIGAYEAGESDVIFADGFEGTVP